LTARERVLATRTAIEQGKESLRIALLLYEAQKASITDVLDAQAELLKAQTSYFGALASHLVARVDLELAMGKMAETR
jgi:outer membrane protein TolC